MAQYWLLDWLDSEGLGDTDVACGVLRTKEGQARFALAAEEALNQAMLPERQVNSLLAAGSWNLSGQQSCSAPQCLKSTVDQLILTTWHYFERVIVSGLDPSRVGQRVEGTAAKARSEELVRGHIEAALYVRDIGAEEFLFFQRPTQLCVHHLDAHAGEAGLVSAVEAAQALGEELAEGYTLELRQTFKGHLYGFSHPALTYIKTGYVTEEQRREKKALGKELAFHEARILTAGFVRSAALANSTRSVLGQLTSVNSRVLPAVPIGEVTAGDIALNIKLPILHGLTAKELLRIKEHEADEFEVFRGALKTAIELRLARLPEEDAASVADSVTHDVLNPALRNLGRRLALSRRLLGSRSGATVVAGGLVTTVGLFAFAPVTVPGLVIAAGGLANGINDYLKEKRDVEMADLHFLWRVSDMAAGRH